MFGGALSESIFITENSDFLYFYWWKQYCKGRKSKFSISVFARPDEHYWQVVMYLMAGEYRRRKMD